MTATKITQLIYVTRGALWGKNDGYQMTDEDQRRARRLKQRVLSLEDFTEDDITSLEQIKPWYAAMPAIIEFHKDVRFVMTMYRGRARICTHCRRE